MRLSHYKRLVNRRSPSVNLSISVGIAIVAVLQLILPAISIVLAIEPNQQQGNFNSHLVLDEEISFNPRNEFERSDVEFAALQVKHEVEANKNLSAPANQKQSHPVQTPKIDVDPFAFTFEDYNRDSDRGDSIQRDAAAITANDSSLPLSTAIPGSSSLIIEDEDNLVKPKESPIIDFIFPSNSHHKHHGGATAEQSHQMNEHPDAANSNADDVLSEIKLLFAWKQLPTNKCSKTCGKGFRLNHLSCIDLKYNVKIEDDLCLKSKVPKPSGLSDEPCNEIDCAPQWTSIEFQDCNSASYSNGICHPNRYKRVQCTMVNRHGLTIHLDDSKCNSTQAQGAPVEKDDPKDHNQHSSRSQYIDEYNVDFTVSEADEGNEANDIPTNIDSESSYRLTDARTSAEQQQREPFYEAGQWSNCSGAPCGQIGRRYRKLRCLMYFSRSSKFVEVSKSNCINAHSLDTEEPCYIDCQPEIVLNENNSPQDSLATTSLDETVYDLEMTRFTWRKDGWTKCSAECLGGQRETMIDCWDTVAQATVDSSFCDEDMKPKVAIESCNDIPCPPEWRVEPFSKCTKSCGSSGIRTRSVACVQQVMLPRGPEFMVVSSDLCIQSNVTTPHLMEPCNRFDCRPEWSVGPWSECSRKCGQGVRNRTIICVQEFANRDGPKPETTHRSPHKLPSPDLLEAIAISSKNWHPGKVTQVPFQECYEEYRTIPALDEACSRYCELEPYIDSDSGQDYRMRQDLLKKRTINLKVGGKAGILAGKNLKIRCRILNLKSNDNLVMTKSNKNHVDWSLNGVSIFPNGTTMAEKQYSQDDNSILGDDVFADDKNQYMADEPSVKRAVRLASSPSHNRTRTRSLMTRSWSIDNNQQGSTANYVFIPSRGGRFSLVKENTLRIKRLRTDDSGKYTCSYGQLKESLELKVVSLRDLTEIGDTNSIPM